MSLEYSNECHVVCHTGVLAVASSFAMLHTEPWYVPCTPSTSGFMEYDWWHLVSFVAFYIVLLYE